MNGLPEEIRTPDLLLRRQQVNQALARFCARFVQFCRRRKGAVQPGRRPLYWTLSALLIAGCGGGGDAPISTAKAEAAAQVEVAPLLAVLRPGSDGVWYIQGSPSHPDPDHSPVGVMSVSADQSDYLEVCFDRKYTHAGSIIVQPDDDFGPAGVQGFTNLGKECAQIKVYVRGVRIHPRDILNFVPAGDGNFWIVGGMVNRR